MTELVVFDLDGTLANPGEAMPEEALVLLRRLRDSGVRIALSSGKPCFYLCGFARQLGIPDAYLVGENGAVLQEGVALPPQIVKKYPIPEKTRDALKRLRRKMEELFRDSIWYQPNESALTPFPSDPKIFDPLRVLLQDEILPEENLTVYEHPDCFDVVYSSLSKASGITLLEEVTGISRDHMIAVGDWVNDYPMFDAVGYSVGIHLPEEKRASVNVPNIQTALSHILEKLFMEKSGGTEC